MVCIPFPASLSSQIPPSLPTALFPLPVWMLLLFGFGGDETTHLLYDCTCYPGDVHHLGSKVPPTFLRHCAFWCCWRWYFLARRIGSRGEAKSIFCSKTCGMNFFQQTLIQWPTNRKIKPDRKNAEKKGEDTKFCFLRFIFEGSVASGYSFLK